MKIPKMASVLGTAGSKWPVVKGLISAVNLFASKHCTHFLAGEGHNTMTKTSFLNNFRQFQLLSFFKYPSRWAPTCPT